MNQEKKTPQPQTPKKLKILSFNAHVPVPFGTGPSQPAIQSIGGKKEHEDLTLEPHPLGIMVKYPNTDKGLLVFAANIQYAKIQFEE